MEASTVETLARIREIIAAHPDLARRMVRQIQTVLHTRGITSVDEIYDESRLQAGSEPLDREEEEDPNSPSTVRLEEEKEQEDVLALTLQYAAENLTVDEVEEMLHQVLLVQEAEQLESFASLPGVPFTLLSERLRRFCALPESRAHFTPSGMIGTKVALARNFISDQLEFVGVAKRYLDIADFEWVIDRVIGPSAGSGRIGGKAAGMLLGYRILQGANREHADDATARVLMPESWFLRSDVIQLFLRENGFDEYQNQKYKTAEDARREYPLIRQIFRNARFPAEIVRQLERILRRVGKHPLIVRSSSLLEDRFGAAFSGKYASIFLANQGPFNRRLRELLRAVAEVYASTLAPNPMQYRRRHELIDYNEDMAILIQRVVGRRHGKFFLPGIAGVAFSRNEYRWSPRIRPEDGMARVVLGLGTRAVDRTGNDYSRIVALGAPTLRPEVTADRIVRYSQRFVDVIDMEQDRFRSIPLAELLAEGLEAPGMLVAASVYSDNSLVEPVGGLVGVDPSTVCLTFDKLLRRTPFASRMREQLRRLEDAYEVPINVEYAIIGDEVHLLQCRPLVQAEAASFIQLPRHVPRHRQLFATREVIRSGEVRNIDYVVFVDPRAYNRLQSRDTRLEIGRAVGRINDALEGQRFLLMGPGRWGSNDSSLGVKVTYSEINHCSVLIEVALSREGFIPEVSYGTHFFQDLVEDGIFYLPIHPEESGVYFNEEFLLRARNSLVDLSPRDADHADTIHVIKVADHAPGQTMHLVMDGDAGKAVCWLE